MGATACGGRGLKGWAGASGERPIGAGQLQTATQPGVMPTPPLPTHPLDSLRTFDSHLEW